MDTPDTSSMSWTVVLPVKRLDRAKTRLHVPGIARPDLALAFALDTVAAVLGSSRVASVVIVTDDAIARAAMPGDGRIQITEDTPDAGLNPALVHGAGLARGNAGAAVAAVSSDLIALRAQDLDEVLSAAGQASGACFVGDQSGIGSTMYLSPRGVGFAPEFGRRSRAAHRASGATEVIVAGGERARRDVDTEVDLWDAMRLGVGIHTRALMADHRIQL